MLSRSLDLSGTRPLSLPLTSLPFLGIANSLGPLTFPRTHYSRNVDLPGSHKDNVYHGYKLKCSTGWYCRSGARSARSCSAAPLRLNTSLVSAELWMSVDMGDARDVQVRNCRCLWMSLGAGLGPNGACHLALPPSKSKLSGRWRGPPAQISRRGPFFFLLIVIHWESIRGTMLLANIFGSLYAAVKSWALSVSFINNLVTMFLHPTMNLFRGLRSTTRSPSQLRDVAPRVFPTTGFTVIPASETVKEEHWPCCTPQSLYPVSIGDVLHSKYQVLYKLGYGTTSTIWMCRDLSSVHQLLLHKIAERLYPAATNTSA